MRAWGVDTIPAPTIFQFPMRLTFPMRGQPMYIRTFSYFQREYIENEINDTMGNQFSTKKTFFLSSLMYIHSNTLCVLEKGTVAGCISILSYGWKKYLAWKLHVLYSLLLLLRLFLNFSNICKGLLNVIESYEGSFTSSFFWVYANQKRVWEI